MGSNWLKGPREAAGVKQDALALKVELDSRVLGRLERCERETPRQVPYARLAAVLKVCPIRLAEEHARDLADANLADHAARARDEADRLRRAKHFPPSDPRPIASALNACAATELVERIAERAPSLPDGPAQAAHIARLLDEGRLDTYANLVDTPLEETIARTATADRLDALERFLRAILLACAAEDDGLDPGRWHLHHGETKAWPFRAMIDRSQRLDGMRLVRAAPHTAEARLDDGPDSTRAVRSGNVSQISADARLHQLVCEIADTLGTVDQDRPAATDGQGLTGFCRTVNNELFRHNSRHTHVFGLWERCTCEADEVRQALLRALPNLRLFDCGDPARASTVLRADRDTLETWYASHLRAIAERRKTLASTPTPATPPAQPTAKPEPIPMNDPQGAAPINVSVNVNTGKGPANQAAGRSHAHQHHLSSAQAELLPLLERLLAVTGTGEPHYIELRKACREAQGELEENEPLPAPVKTRLRRAIDALPTADSALEIAAKVAEAIGRIPGLGL